MAAELQVRRYEEKYLLAPAQAAALQNLLDGVLQRDRYSANGAYFIRSLYFDTPADADYKDKLLGVSERKKLRLRLYDVQAQQVKLEIKAKRAKNSHKQSAVLDRSTALALVNGDPTPLLAEGPAARAAYALYQGEHRAPAALIDYERTAWVFPVGRARITLDSHVRASKSDSLFEANVPMVGVLDPMTILEVKYDRPLPSWLGRMLSSIPGAPMSISKYAMARARLY